MKKLILFCLIIILVNTLIGCGSGGARQEKSADGTPPAPSIGGYNVYMGHIHNHSNISDGAGSPDQAYTYARDVAKMDFFGLSDHSNSFSFSEWTNFKNIADRYNQDDQFVTFWGFEWSSSGNYGHITIINTSDYCMAEDINTNTFTKLCTWLSATDGVAFFNHPGRENNSGNEFNHFATAPCDKIIGMELWNAGVGFDKYYYNDGYYLDDENKGYYDEALTRGWYIGASGSGDDHIATWGTAQPYRHAVLATRKTRSAILEAFLERRFYSTTDKNLAISFKINSNEMGSKISAGSYNAEISMNDGTDSDLFSRVDLIKNGTIINSWFPNRKEAIININLAVSTNEYYYVKVKQADNDEAISSPIWIR